MIKLFSKSFQIARQYFWDSDERLKRLTYLLGIVICIGLLAFAGGMYAWWLAGFWQAMALKSMAAFGSSLLVYAGITVGVFLLTILNHYLIENLEIDWRDSLTKSMIKRYVPDAQQHQSDVNQAPNYLNLSRENQVDNIQQRIQDDVRLYVHISLHSGSSFISSIMKFIIFSQTLWAVGGALSLYLFGINISIPGYLVWMAIAYSAIGTFIINKIGDKLPEINGQQKKLEAELVSELALVKQEAETIALEQAEGFHLSKITHKLALIKDNLLKRIDVKIPLIGFQKLHGEISSVFAYLAAAPLYFSGLMELAQMMQVGYAFRSVADSLSWFVDSYEMMSIYDASMTRLLELDQHLTIDTTQKTDKHIQLSVDSENDKQIRVSKLSLSKPNSSEYIFKNLSLTMNKGENTLISGQSGIGKSMFCKAIANCWGNGEGEIQLPSQTQFCFLSQKVYLPFDTLKSILSYPQTSDVYTEEQYQAVLEKVGLSELKSELNQFKDWSKIPEGQKQTLAFARICLKKPDWAFLDESTSSLEEHKTQQLYQLIKNELPSTTYVTFSKDERVRKYHSRVLEFVKHQHQDDIMVRDISHCAKNSSEFNVKNCMS